ncbi:MAG: ABC transporter ATP-binding protein [Bacteroidetes bacterium]|nr:ABC transporter ATP-binding protein [Bacteroidota bacterium]
MIVIHNLSFSYHEKPVLQELNICFEENLTHGIVGLNGSGKTTFFNILSGFLSPDKGHISMNGEAIKKNDIAYIDAESFFYPKLTAVEFLSVFPKTNVNYHEGELANVFDLPLDEFIDNYSTGMKKKLLIISQLKQDKKIFILDEPFNGLDMESNKTLQLIIELLNKKNKTIFIASHIIEPLYTICQKIHHLKDKQFAKSYTSDQFNRLDAEVFGDFSENLKQTLSQSL